MSIRWISVGMALSALAATGCTVGTQVQADLQYRQLIENTAPLGREGIGILTPSAPTGQEADRQALADALGEILDRDVEEAEVVPLPALLSAVNQAGLAKVYSNMYTEYDRTGILDREMLMQVGRAANVRYLAKVNLGDFKQEASSRIKLLGVRFLDTRTATIRVHLEIWDAHSGAIVWQGNEELTYAQERVRERPVTFQQVAGLAAERLVAKVGDSGREVVREEAEAVADATPPSVPGNCGNAPLAALAPSTSVEPVAYTVGC